jgi:hypothetical protein
MRTTAGIFKLFTFFFVGVNDGIDGSNIQVLIIASLESPPALTAI